MDKDTGRVEAFSDGVFAIAITLLILEIRVPELREPFRNGQLVTALLELWPSFVAFLFSFFVILVMWVNHHELVRWVRIADYPFLFANGLVLLMVTFVPFPTAIVARYLGTDASRAAVGFYCATFLCISVSFNALLLSITRHGRLLRPEVPAHAVAAWHAVAGLVLCMSLWVVWTRLCYEPPREGVR
jgi:uncharacterized membrane protein